MKDYDFLHTHYETDSCANSLLKNAKVLIVEDNISLGESVRKYLSRSLIKFDIECEHFSSAIDCIRYLDNSENIKNELGPICLVTDIGLEGDIDGLELIGLLQEKKVEFFSLVVTGFASIETAIEATKKGAYHYLTKPFELENLRNLVISGFCKRWGIELEDQKRVEFLTERGAGYKSLLKGPRIEHPAQADIFCSMIGRSNAMKQVFERIKKVANTDSTILITGASGTGKELVASALHKLSSRGNENIVSVNCGAIPSELLESELFGHVKGSFTGAIADRKGRFELAHNGTIFLDEIGDMPLLLQVKLLRVLQTLRVTPVGGQRPVDVDVRVITATHQDIESNVKNGLFREDLFYRLNVIPIKIPSLKDRVNDIPLLISYFLSRFVSSDGSNAIEFNEETLKLLLNYNWPGNVRELENLIERLVILKGGHLISPEDLPNKIYNFSSPKESAQFNESIELPEDGIDLKRVLSEIEEMLIFQALQRTNGNKNQAAKLLQINRTTLIEKMRKKGMNSLTFS